MKIGDMFMAYRAWPPNTKTQGIVPGFPNLGSTEVRLFEIWRITPGGTIKAQTRKVKATQSKLVIMGDSVVRPATLLMSIELRALFKKEGDGLRNTTPAKKGGPTAWTFESWYHMTPLEELMKKAADQFRSMTPEERKAMTESQKESYVRAEIGMGSDADEEEYRRALREGDQVKLDLLNQESLHRMAEYERQRNSR